MKRNYNHKATTQPKEVDFKGAIAHFEEGYKARYKNRSLVRKIAKPALLAAAGFGLLGVAAGAGSETGRAVSEHDTNSPIVKVLDQAKNTGHEIDEATNWVTEPIVQVTERVEDIINPDNVETNGNQTVIAKKGDNINTLAEHVRGWANLTPEQFSIMVNQIEAVNGIENNESLIEGMAVEVPESVKP
jgi:hypothetical protein